MKKINSMMKLRLQKKAKELAEKDPLKIYWDRNDELGDEWISKILNGKAEEVEEEILDLNLEHICNLEDERAKEIFTEVYKNYDVDVDEIIEENSDVRDLIYDYINCDLNIEELLDNTGKIICFYDTGYYMESESWSWSLAHIRLVRMEIKKHIGIMHTSYYDKDLDMMIAQATYGGSLNIYFQIYLSDILEAQKGNINAIKFSSFWLGVVNSSNGSGDVMAQPINEDVVFKLDWDNLIYERDVEYNWTYSIAGMVSDWCVKTIVEFDNVDFPDDVVIEKSSVSELLKRENEYEKIYQEGKCTLGDMNYRRHRNTTYTNDFPCGNRCLDCGTFWID